jgi:hypothetical protein
MEYNVLVELVLSTTSTREMHPPLPMRFQARQYLSTRLGDPIIPGTTRDHPQYVSVREGDRLLIELFGRDPIDANRWAIGPRAADPAAGTLTAPLFSFPVGTPAARVLDASEWTCTTAMPTRGLCAPPDAGIDV